MWIQGNQFKTLAKWQYAPARLYTGHPLRDSYNNIPVNDYRYMRNTLDFLKLKSDDIIYTHTFYADQLFEKLEKINGQFIVITHNADTPADFPPPDNVFWFTTNVAIRYNGPTFGFGSNIRSIPIGIENDFWLKDKKRKMESLLTKPKRYKNLLYMNHNIKTNPAKRKRPYDLLKGEKYVTAHVGSNGQGFDNYIDNIYNHPFVVCPEGNGLDTHRVWECLYMKTIPIVTRNINNSFYTDLPILFIDDWQEINEKFLHDMFMDMSMRKWNMDKLNFEYWKNEIVSSNAILQ
jgi:hypothetical protein